MISSPASCPRVSIIVPAFNSAEFLGDTLRSALASTWPDFEVIVMDDGSTDGTADVVAPFVNEHRQVKYFRQENCGVSAARNHAIRKSTGKYILPLDADDLIAPDYIAKAVAILESQPAVSIVYCRAERFGAESGPWRLPDFSMLNMLVMNCIFCSALFRRSDYDRMGGYGETLRHGLEDWDFWLGMLELGGGVHRIEEVLFRYRIRRTSMTFTAVRENPRAILEAIIERHRPLYLKHLVDIVDYAGLLHTRQQTALQRFVSAWRTERSRIAAGYRQLADALSWRG